MRLAFRIVPALVAVLLASTTAPPEARAQAGGAPAGVDAQMSFDPSGPIGVGELVRLTIKVSSARRLPDASPFLDFDNLDVVNGPQTTTSLQFVNGRTTQSLGYTWVVRAREVGRARVHSAGVRVGRQEIDLPEQSVEVVAEAPPRRRQRDPFDSIFGRRGRAPDADDPFDRFFDRRRRQMERRRPRAPEIFLRAEVTPRRPFVGQQVLYTLYLYTDVNVRSVAPTDLPDFKGFWTTVIPQEDGEVQPERVVHDGREIGRVVLLQRALFPRREGRLEIEPVTAEMRALLDQGSPFGSIIPQVADITRSSKPVVVDVQPLPEPSPPGFQGVVGRLDVDAALEPRALEVGEAATLTIRLHGAGHVQGAPAPTLPAVDGLEVFPPQRQSDQSLRGTRVVGERAWSYVLVPQRPGTLEIPPLELPVFDPRDGDYRTLRTEPLALDVRGATRLARDGGGTAELHGIRETVVPLRTAVAPSWPVRHLLFVLPFVLAFGFMWLRGRGGGATARSRLLHALSAAKAAAASNGDDPGTRPRETAAAIETAWRDYLAERWNVPPGTASTQWQNRLVDAGAPVDAAEELVRLADDLHYLRYAPKLSSTEELQRELIDRSRRLARRLR